VGRLYGRDLISRASSSLCRKYEALLWAVDMQRIDPNVHATEPTGQSRGCSALPGGHGTRSLLLSSLPPFFFSSPVIATFGHNNSEISFEPMRLGLAPLAFGIPPPAPPSPLVAPGVPRSAPRPDYKYRFVQPGSAALTRCFSASANTKTETALSPKVVLVLQKH
jgi:hypothetical protein